MKKTAVAGQPNPPVDNLAVSHGPVFFQGKLPDRTTPLARFLPPIPTAAATAWLTGQVRPGGWVLDPFGASPRLAVEMAHAGWRVLVASNNPIDRFLIDLSARPPSAFELRSALADLGATTRGGTRLEPHLRSLYNTTCDQCQQEVMAESFIWQRGEPAPVARVYQCQNCGNAGEFPALPADEERLAHLSGGGLHRARALERVAALDDPDRSLVEEALDTYLPRALYALITLVNKMEGMPDHLHRPLSALILAAFDQANTLWPHPGQRARPRLLTVPPQFRENNIWLALEEAVEAWSQALPDPDQPVPLVHWPSLPPESGGICLFDGRLRELKIAISTANSIAKRDEHSADIQIQAVVAALPRPNQAYWTLSTLWAGWLWGREAAAPFKQVLRRRRYDWAWHTAALAAAWENLPDLLALGAPVLGLIGESEPGFLSAGLLSACLSSLALDGLALRQEQAQIHWMVKQSAVGPQKFAESSFDDQIIGAARPAALAYLQAAGEPSNYLRLHAAALVELVGATGALELPGQPPQEVYSQVQAAFQKAFSAAGFIRYGGSPHSLDVGLWWKVGVAQGVSPGIAPLGDRVEMEIVRLLVKSDGLSSAEIERIVCTAFPGLLTPEPELVEAILESYGESADGLWRLRTGERPEQRRQDLAEMRQVLLDFGQKLGLNAQPAGPNQRWITWSGPSGSLQAAFYLLPSAVLGSILSVPDYPPAASLLAFPGSRAGLIAFKLRRDPRLQGLLESGWRLGKFRHLRRLEGSSDVTIENLSEQLALDPIDRQDPQMAMI